MKIPSKLFVIAAFVIAGTSIQCKSDKKEKMPEETPQEEVSDVSITKSDFGALEDGTEIEKYTLKNTEGMEVSIITYGGRITNLKTPDKNGKYEDVVLGFDSISQYTSNNPYFGALIGRYGNRIANGKFTIDGTDYQLPVNDGPNSLHGGTKGFDKVVWTAEEMPAEDNSASLKLTYTSKDMEQGYPGNLETAVTYTLTDDNKLEVNYQATTDKKTVVNLTQHSYFNLSGDFNKPIVGDKIMINADQFVPVNATLIPTGELKDVAGTPFDFREPKTIGDEINATDDQIKKGGGYDHCWILNDQNSGARLAASAYDPESGRFLEVYTDEPGIQFYTGNFLDGTLPQKGGEGTYAHRTGFCLETQHYPDSPNQKDFPTTILNPGEKYNTTTTFQFSTK
ncbi:MAG: aldose epimerase family protein [Leeuwenhoekiella sp.]